MADLIPDEIVLNILARFPAKPLLRFRCVSKHWNRMLKSPFFMNLRSRRSIILPLYENLCVIDDNVPNGDPPHSVLKCYPFENPHSEFSVVNVIGNFNGIVVLNYSMLDITILYNPFTGVSKKLPQPPKGTYMLTKGVYGFCYGATLDDLKIVRFRQSSDICDVYSFKKASWSSWSTSRDKIEIEAPVGFYLYDHYVGTFLNGFLHWQIDYRDTLLVLNVNDMVISEMHLPFKRIDSKVYRLGTLGGCLCSLNVPRDNTKYDVWTMNDYGIDKPWSKTYSFTLAFKGSLKRIYYPLCILDSGRIFFQNILDELIIYDTSKDVCTTLNISLLTHKPRWIMPPLEFVESLVSPSDILISRLDKTTKKRKARSGNIF